MSPSLAPARSRHLHPRPFSRFALRFSNIFCMNKRTSFLYALSASLTVIAIWSIASYGKLVSPIFVPTPTAALRAFIAGIRDFTLISDFLWTSYRFLAAFVLAVLIGTPIGI